MKQTWIVLLELMGRPVGIKLDRIVIMRFNLDMGRLKNRRVKKKKFYEGFLDDKLTYGDQLLENSAMDLVITNK